MSTDHSPIKTPIVIYIAHHPDCQIAHQLSQQLYQWFRLGDQTGDAADAGLPVYYRRQIQSNRLHPTIDWQAAHLNVVILLADHQMIGDAAWREAIIELAKEAERHRQEEPKKSEQTSTNPVLFLPVALHESFYRTGPLYQHFNPVRLLDMTAEQRLATLRRAATEAAARALRAMQAGQMHPPPLNIFLSHAKRDGTTIAERLRDGVRQFGQLIAWYDANDLPYGGAWQTPMEEAASRGAAAMVATVTDAYASRPWCRREAMLARTPRPVNGSKRVWGVQPVVAVHQPRDGWARSMPMLEGVPRIGWHGIHPDEDTARVIDRLVLEMLLTHTHQLVAQELAAHAETQDLYFITWPPDTWTLIMLRNKLVKKQLDVRQIAYPGHGLRTIEAAELQTALRTFGRDVKLATYEEVWP